MSEVDVNDPETGEAEEQNSRWDAVSDRSHRRFPTVAAYVAELGGPKSRVIEKVLIANNGVGAVKAIRSIRRWAYELFGDERAISFVVMATPEDLRANAEYIRMGDVIVDVPGGSNNHNYANVTLIVELARLHVVHAVWAGWGHASENPLLPDTLAQSNPPIEFIGPSGPPMRALGDKIGSTIIAQSAGVPCIAWNGGNVKAYYNQDTGKLPGEAFDEASIHSATEACEAAERIGFPIMIKASEGGGGKGIRRVDKSEDVLTAYRQVCGEVPGSPIFIMKLASNSRHLEVQLLADLYGNAIALNGRDCSVQRRHQKIIEEGPPLAAPRDVWNEMEKAAVSLAKAVGYANAGTVEYLYSEADNKFYFLELNPRLQVEHPVTEMITNVNLPAAQLQVAMGIPLYNISSIRELYGKDRFESNPSDRVIDFDTAKRNDPTGHCIAVRITAENAEAGFKPTSGGIQELNFRSTPSVWGYFSMDSSGSIHEFADSQFGHLFASGLDREQARRNMVLALKELSIRGDISTTIDYISKLIELDDFIANRITTAWLDGLIKANVDGIGTAEGDLFGVENKNTLNNHLYVVMGATIMAHDLCADGEQQFMDFLTKGKLPSQSLLGMVHDIELILTGVKYKLRCTRNGPNTFTLAQMEEESKSIVNNVRVLSDAGYLIDIGGQSHVVYMTSKADVASGIRLNVGGANIAFSPDYDPTSLRTDVAGKLVKRLVPDGAKVKKGEPFAEIEVMKMFMPLKVEESGIVTWCMNEGAALAAGDLLATLQLENPENVAPVTVYKGDLSVAGWGASGPVRNMSRPHLMLRHAVEKIKGGMAGYTLSKKDFDAAIQDLEYAVTDPLLPVLEIDEQLSVLSGRIPADLFSTIFGMIQDFKTKYQENSSTGVQLRFPAERVVEVLTAFSNGILSHADRTAFDTLTNALLKSAMPYAKSHASGVPGSERVMSSFLGIIREWVSVERWFCDGKSYSDAVDNLRRANKDSFDNVINICRAHAGIETTSSIISMIVSMISDASRIDSVTSFTSPIGKRVSILTGAESLSNASACLSEIGALKGLDAYAEPALKARKLLLQESMPSLEQRKRKFEEAAKKLADATDGAPAYDVEEVLADHLPMGDVLYPLLKNLQDGKEQIAFMELYLRYLYRPYTLNTFERKSNDRSLRFSFQNKPSERAISANTPVASMTDLTRILSSTSLDKRVLERSDSESSFLQPENKEKIPPSTIRTGLVVLVDTVEDLEDAAYFEQVLANFPQFLGGEDSFVGLVNVMYIIVLSGTVSPESAAMDAMATTCVNCLSSYTDLMTKAGIRRVSFIIDKQQDDEFKEYSVPASFTYRGPDFKEEELFRNIEPSHVYHLELNRVAHNFNIKSLGRQHTTTCHVHLYEATPRPAALLKDKKANKAPRVFARAISFTLDFSSSSFERVLVDALNAVDVVALKSKSDNHLFVNLESHNENSVLDPVVVEQVVVDILKRHGSRISALGIVEVETRVVCCLRQGSPPIALRLVASNPTGYVHVMSTYVEAADEKGGNLAFKLIGGTKASLASSGDSSWEGMSTDTPYPLTRPFDAQRKAAAQSSDTLYCYDFPALFEAAVEQQWIESTGRDQKGSSNRASGLQAPGRPLMVMYTHELVVQNKVSPSKRWSIEDYLNGSLELVQVNRRAGSNDVGMVAWLMVLKTVEYPEGRQVVLIANDITFKAGSFGTREDVVFKLASEFAREHRIPRLYIAANSGARIGLAERVKKTFKVAFKEPSKPENGFDFIYVSKEDYAMLTESKAEIIATEAKYNGEMVYKVTDIIGSEPDLGVENLKGSGLIAGETSSAYQDIFTLTLVLGRTVGIGAYLVRLGQRTIQKATASPIILTGYQALNKLMGVNVYSTNDQLGGPGIMYPNGISHIVESDHLRSIKAAIDWLSFVPSCRGGILPITDIRGIDDIDRPVTFTPSPGVPYDPRMLLAGGIDDLGIWQSGFFDNGSFTESLAGWAKTVVVGRARLGGIPMGVVITENRTAEAVKPADPADVKASEAVIQQAGCVWFPNSAYKTAQAINDFRTEDLPLMVFANWRGFSGGQRDMFDEVLKYGSLIVDAFVAYTQPVFVFIPPYAEIRGGAWVVLDASINAGSMEMYASSRTARGGVLEANGAASVKYRTAELLATMHRLDDTLQQLDKQLEAEEEPTKKESVQGLIAKRERALLPVYGQIAVQFCELHDTPGRMKAVGVIEREVEWSESRSFFYWRLRRKLAEFDLRKKIIEAAEVGRGVKTPTAIEASNLIKSWFVQTPGMDEAKWVDDKAVLTWMAHSHQHLEEKILAYTKSCVAQEVIQVLTAGGNTARVGAAGIVEGLARAYGLMSPEERAQLKEAILVALT